MSNTSIDYYIYRACSDEFYTNTEGEIKVFQSKDEVHNFPVWKNDNWNEVCCVFPLQVTKTFKQSKKDKYEMTVETKVEWIQK